MLYRRSPTSVLTRNGGGKYAASIRAYQVTILGCFWSITKPFLGVSCVCWIYRSSTELKSFPKKYLKSCFFPASNVSISDIIKTLLPTPPPSAYTKSNYAKTRFIPICAIGVVKQMWRPLLREYRGNRRRTDAESSVKQMYGSQKN